MTITERLRRMKPGEVITLPSTALAGIKSMTLSRLRKELIAERADWVVGAQNPYTGEFKVRRITKEA